MISSVREFHVNAYLKKKGKKSMNSTPLQIVLHTGVTLRLNAEVNSFLALFVEQLQLNAGMFFSSLQTSASCATSIPFHIQLLSSATLQGLTCQQIANILKDLCSKFNHIQGRILPICIVSSSGYVSLRTSSDDYSALIRHLADALGDNGSTIDWTLEQENFVVTIGTFQVSVR